MLKASLLSGAREEGMGFPCQGSYHFLAGVDVAGAHLPHPFLPNSLHVSTWPSRPNTSVSEQSFCFQIPLIFHSRDAPEVGWAFRHCVHILGLFFDGIQDS